MKNNVKKISASVLFGLLAVSASLSVKSVNPVMALDQDDFVCAHIVFGNKIDTKDANFDLTTPETLSEHIEEVSGITYNDFTLTDFNVCNYRQVSYGTLRVGGSTRAGSFNLNLLNGLECNRAIVYAAGFDGDTSTFLEINGCTNEIHHTTGENYDFTTPYVFDFTANSTLNISNHHITQNGRSLIYKIVLRVYSQNLSDFCIIFKKTVYINRKPRVI